MKNIEIDQKMVGQTYRTMINIYMRISKHTPYQPYHTIPYHTPVDDNQECVIKWVNRIQLIVVVWLYFAS